MTANQPAVFLDTSIHIARTVREPAMRNAIKNWLARYSLTISSAVVVQEFKNRVLRDIAYVLTKLHKSQSYLDTLHYITNVLPAQQQRKIRICVPVLQNLLPGATDAELTERALLYCRALLLHGAPQPMRELDMVVARIDCHWSKFHVREKKRYVDYDFGGRRCDATRQLCQVGASLKAKEARCVALLAFLNGLPNNRLTAELESARDFLQEVLRSDFQNVTERNPCSTVGDLLIALDSDGVKNMYTMNYRESQAYADFLDQNIAVRPNNPATPETEHLAIGKPWPTL